MGAQASRTSEYGHVDSINGENASLADGVEMTEPGPSGSIHIDYGATDIIGRRKGMEDAYCDHVDLNAEFPQLESALGGPLVRRALFGVFDGHGGRMCSEYVAEEFASHLVSQLVSHGGLESAGSTVVSKRSGMQRRYSSHKTGVSEGLQASVLNAVLSVERAYGQVAKAQYDEFEMKKHRIRRSPARSAPRRTKQPPEKRRQSSQRSRRPGLIAPSLSCLLLATRRLGTQVPPGHVRHRGVSAGRSHGHR